MSKKPLRVFRVNPENESIVNRVWPPVREFLTKDASHWDDYMDTSDFYRRFILKDLILFIGAQEKIDCCLFCEILEFDRSRVAQAAYAGGLSLVKYLALLDKELVKLGRETGCNLVSLAGRAAWEKLARPFGYNKRIVTLIKEI